MPRVKWTVTIRTGQRDLRRYALILWHRTSRRINVSMEHNFQWKYERVLNKIILTPDFREWPNGDYSQYYRLKINHNQKSRRKITNIPQLKFSKHFSQKSNLSKINKKKRIFTFNREQLFKNYWLFIWKIKLRNRNSNTFEFRKLRCVSSRRKTARVFPAFERRVQRASDEEVSGRRSSWRRVKRERCRAGRGGRGAPEPATCARPLSLCSYPRLFPRYRLCD